MLCEKCQIRQATIHLTEIIKDVKSELHLCENCAKEIGLNSKISNFTISIPEMLSFLEINELENEKSLHSCKTCGLAYAELRKTSKMGCPDCYENYKDTVESLLLNLHGEKQHIGKNPLDPAPYIDLSLDSGKIKPVTTISELKNELSNAITDERFEEAAIIRDKIREIM